MYTIVLRRRGEIERENGGVVVSFWLQFRIRIFRNIYRYRKYANGEHYGVEEGRGEIYIYIYKEGVLVHFVCCYVYTIVLRKGWKEKKIEK